MENGLSTFRTLSRGPIKTCNRRRDWIQILQKCWAIKSLQAHKIWMQKAGREWELCSNRAKMHMTLLQEAKVEKGWAMRSSIPFSIHSQGRVVSKGTRDRRDQQPPLFWSKTNYLPSSRLNKKIIRSRDRVVKAQVLCLPNHQHRVRVAGKETPAPWLVRILLDRGKEGRLHWEWENKIPPNKALLGVLDKFLKRLARVNMERKNSILNRHKMLLQRPRPTINK